jgi:histidine triad (HIT) family protein
VLQETFRPKKVGLLIGGLDVPHVHIHLVPIETIHDLDYDQQVADPAEEAMGEALERIRVTLRSLGYAAPP